MSTMETEQISQSPDQTEDGKAMLEHFHPSRRSYVSNTFLYAVRAGAQTPREVLAAVEHELRETARRSERWGFIDTVERTETVYAVLNEHYDEALAFAAWAIAWEALPPGQKARQKAQKGAIHRQAYLDAQPATDKQVAYLRALGYQGVVTSKAQASTLIDELRNGKQRERLS